MSRDKKIQVIAANLSRELADRGQIIEGGWRAYELITGIAYMSETQRKECRKAFFAGSHHVFFSVLGMLEEGTDATPNDLSRMDKLDKELRVFMEEMKRE